MDRGLRDGHPKAQQQTLEGSTGVVLAPCTAAACHVWEPRPSICGAPQELHLTGIAVATDGLCLVVAEGGAKAQKKYAKLLLHRIDWAAGRDEDANSAAAGGASTCRRPAHCADAALPRLRSGAPALLSFCRDRVAVKAVGVREGAASSPPDHCR